METVAQEAKRLLEPIPEEQWIVDNYVGEVADHCCALGHIRRVSERPIGICPETIGSRFDFELRLRAITKNYLFSLNEYYEDGFGIVSVNDGDIPEYSQQTPKQRVMALLDDMIAAGY